MPVYHDLKIPPTDNKPDAEDFVFARWLTTERSHIPPGTALAMVDSGDARYLLRHWGKRLGTPRDAIAGEAILAARAIARVATGGDLVPYGRAYFTLAAAAPDRL